MVAGIDEVGRGAWAGPVVAGAMVLPAGLGLYQADLVESECLPRWLRDSKSLTHQQRLETAGQLKKLTDDWAIGQAEVEEIDGLGIGRATFLAMERAVAGLKIEVEYLLVDGSAHPAWAADKQLAMAKGDAKSATIAAASILAKVYRDQLMDELAIQCPEYGFETHKGYGTAQHRQAIAEHGLLPVHRTSFKILK